MNKLQKPGHLQLADELDDWSEGPNTHVITSNAAAEIRRLHAELQSVQDQRRAAFRTIDELNDKNQALKTALDLIANTGMDAGQCRLTALDAMKSQP